MFPPSSSSSRGSVSSSRSGAFPLRNRFELLATEIAAAEARADQRVRGERATAPAARRLQALPDPALGYYRNNQSDFRTFDGSIYFLGVSGLTPRDAAGCTLPRPYPACVLGLDSTMVDDDGNLPDVVFTPSGNYTNVLTAIGDATRLLERAGSCSGDAWSVDQRSDGLRQPWLSPLLGMSLVCGRGLAISDAWLRNTTHLLDQAFHTESTGLDPAPAPVLAATLGVLGGLAALACVGYMVAGCPKITCPTCSVDEEQESASDDDEQSQVRATGSQEPQQARGAADNKRKAQEPVQLHTLRTPQPGKPTHAGTASPDEVAL